LWLGHSEDIKGEGKGGELQKRSGYLGFIFKANIEPTINPTDSAVITNDQDLTPLKCSSSINGPNKFYL
jgi:hypothetical protein